MSQEAYQQGLIDYVMANSSKTEQQAIDYLDEYCQGWREGQPPKANKIEATGEDNE